MDSFKALTTNCDFLCDHERRAPFSRGVMTVL